MADIEPAIFGGYGRKTQASSGGLVNLTFNSRCPPDVQPNTRIIAICGITDISRQLPNSPSSSEADAPSPEKKTGTLMSRGKKLFSPSKRRGRKRKEKAEKLAKKGSGLASPKNDGWFFSDFYLFHHSFRGLGANQLWITSESPSDLVDRYGSYGHGEPKGDHRVVLDDTLLPGVINSGNIRVFQRAQLLQDFLRTFKDECAMAAALDQPVLLMIFGHGDPKTYGVAIGGAGSPRDAPRLRAHHLVASLRGINVSLTMLLTSCYSGGWVLQPELNISALTAAGSEQMSEAWAPSLGGRSHGSIFATAVRLAFTKLEDERATQVHPHPSGEEIDDERLSTTYAELARTIHSTLLYDVDRLGNRHYIQFAAQNDEWALEWRKRSGVPLAQFQAQWDKLPSMAAQKGEGRGYGRTGGMGLGSSSFSEEEPHDIAGPYGHHRKLNKNQSIHAIRDMAYGYLSSFPGRDGGADNLVLHRAASLALDGKKLETWELEGLQPALKYRLDSIKLASEYKDILELNFADCEDFDYGSWEETAILERKDPSARSFKYDLYAKYRKIIDDADVFDPPAREAGWTYTKPYEYLAVACLESGFDTDKVKGAVATLLAVKAARVEALTLRVRLDRTIRAVGSKAFTTLGKRMRSASPPRKRAPIPSFSELINQ